MLNYELAVNFLLILTRVSAFIVVMPAFGGTNTPRLLKIGFSFVLSVLLLPLVTPAAPQIGGGLIGFGLAVLREAVVGLVMGLVCFLPCIALPWPASSLTCT